MVLASVGETLPLALVLSDRDEGFYPRAEVYDGTSLITSVNLAHVADGYYYGAWVPTTSGKFVVIYTVYSDAARTSVALLGGLPRYEPDTDLFNVLDEPLASGGGAVRQSFTLDISTNSIIVNVWLELEGEQVPTGVSDASLRLYSYDGILLSAPANEASPVAQGVFKFTFALPAFSVGENATFSLATIDHNSQTYRGITGVTFSRSS